MNGYSSRLHGIGHMAARLVIKATQDLRAAIKLGGLNAQPIQDTGEFRRDIAASDHKRTLGQGLKMEHLV